MPQMNIICSAFQPKFHIEEICYKDELKKIMLMEELFLILNKSNTTILL
jgi:hypothetical protein